MAQDRNTTGNGSEAPTFSSSLTCDVMRKQYTQLEYTTPDTQSLGVRAGTRSTKEIIYNYKLGFKVRIKAFSLIRGKRCRVAVLTCEQF